MIDVILEIMIVHMTVCVWLGSYPLPQYSVSVCDVFVYVS